MKEKKLLQKHVFYTKDFTQKFILWESSCFELFGDGKYDPLLIQKVNVR